LQKREAAAPKSKRSYKPAAMDTTFTLLLLAIVSIGLVMLFSASSIYANYYYGDSFYYIRRQLVFALIGIAAMFIISRLDYHVWHRLAVPIYVLALVLLLVVLIIPTKEDFKRWIDLGFTTLQPSEVAKFAVIIMLSVMIPKFGEKKMKTFRYGVLYILAVVAPVLLLVIAEPHLSATVLIVLITAVYMVTGGTRMRWFVIAGAAATPAAYYLLEVLGYAKDRVELWLDPFVDPSDKGYQTIQSLFAISSGGLLGQGFGNSRQKFLYVPEPQNDFIFSIVCEELGFVGATVIIVIFALLVWRGFAIAMNAGDQFGSLLTIGIISQVGIQALLNIAVVTNSIPNTGISLPFFSYGGTSLLMLLGEIGIVLSVSRRSRIAKE
jgi:cell division protein FtsW